MGKALAAWLMVAGAMAATAPSPRDVVQGAVTRVIMALQDAQVNRPEPEQAGRLYMDRQRTEIRHVAGDLFDFDEMARRTLTRHWAERTRAEQAEFVRLFTDLLERSYIGRIEAYSGEKIVWVGETVDGAYATVRSKVVTRRNTETPLDYRLLRREGKWKVYDVLIDHVSFVATYRSEFNRIIQLNSYNVLIDKLRKRAVIATDLERRSGTAAASPRLD